MPDLVLSDELTNAFGTEAQNIFDQNASSAKKEEEDQILKDFVEEYEIEKIRDTMDETAQVPESIFFLRWRKQTICECFRIYWSEPYQQRI